MRPIAMAPAVAPRMPMYPPGGPGLGQHIFYGQAQPTFIPPQVITSGNKNYSFYYNHVSRFFMVLNILFL